MLSQHPTPTDRLRILERFRLRLNLQNRLGLPMTLDALADDYVEKELPLLRHGTQQAHLSSLHRWIRPRWGGCHLVRQRGEGRSIPPVLSVYDMRSWSSSINSEGKSATSPISSSLSSSPTDFQAVGSEYFSTSLRLGHTTKLFTFI